MKRTISFLVCLLLFGLTAIFAQDIQIKGTVTGDDDGEPLPGVSVLVKGTTTGTATTVDGEYTLAVPSNATLVFSAVGYETVEIPVAGKAIIDVALTSKVVGLDEVIVAAMATGTPRKKLTVSVDKVGSEELELVPATSAASALQGKVAGITVINSSGNPGQGAGLRLRGSTQLTGTQDPLIIIDGVIYHGALAAINVDDIASYEIVKGASASALYGSRAGSGVLVITSKRGNIVSEGKTEIRVRNEYGFQQLSKKIDLAEHHPYKLSADWESVDTYTRYFGVTYPSGYQGGQSDELIGSRQIDYDAYMDNPYGVLYDYQDDVFTNGQFYTNYVSLANNTGKTRIFLSFENNKNEGIVWETKGSSRQNFRVNIDHNITDKLKLTSSTLFRVDKIDMPNAREATEYGGDEAYGGGQGSFIFNMLFMEPDVDLSQKSPLGYAFEDYYYLPNPWSEEIENPKHALFYEQREMRRRGIVQNLSANYELTKWLSGTADYSFDRGFMYFDRVRPKGYQAERETYIDGQLYKFSNEYLGQTFTGSLNVYKQLGIVLAKAKVAYMYENVKEANFGVTGNGLAAAEITSLDGVTGSKNIESWEGQEIARNYFGILDLDVKDRYLVSVLYRYDGSSLFGENNRWNPYYRVSAGYRITEDLKIPGFQELKIRGAIGTSGQRPGFDYQYETYALAQGNLSKSTIGNKDLKPSETTEMEIGLNAEFLNRVSLEVTASQSVTKDAFVAVPLSAATGYYAQWRNAATLEGKSIEVSLGIDVIKTKSVTWDWNFTFDRVRQKVKELDAPPFQVGPGANEVSAFYLRDNETFGMMYGYEWVKSLDVMANQLGTGETIEDYTVNSDGYVIEAGTEGTRAETPIALDQDGDGTNDFVKIADMNADFNLAFSNLFRFKNVGLSMLWHWKQGGDIYNVTKQWLYRDNRHGDMDCFDRPANEKKAQSYYQTLYSAANVNSHFVEDGTYLKLREMSVFYNVTGNFFQKAGIPFIKGLKIGAMGRNVLTFSNYSGFDPEVSAGSDLTNYAMDIYNYPNFRTLTFSLELTF